MMRVRDGDASVADELPWQFANEDCTTFFYCTMLRDRMVHKLNYLARYIFMFQRF